MRWAFCPSCGIQVGSEVPLQEMERMTQHCSCKCPGCGKDQHCEKDACYQFELSKQCINGCEVDMKEVA